MALPKPQSDALSAIMAGSGQDDDQGMVPGAGDGDAPKSSSGEEDEAQEGDAASILANIQQELAKLQAMLPNV